MVERNIEKREERKSEKKIGKMNFWRKVRIETPRKRPDYTSM